LECPFPADRKRPKIRLAESGQMAAKTNQEEGNATGSCCSLEKYDGRNEEDPKPSLVTSGVRKGSDRPDQEVVQEEAAPDEIPAGWTRPKLEPDW
jgi:hypothetical protein